LHIAFEISNSFTVLPPFLYLLLPFGKIFLKGGDLLDSIERRAHELEEKFVNEYRPAFEELIGELIETMKTKYKVHEKACMKLYSPMLYAIEASVKISRSSSVLLLQEFLKDSK